MNNRDPEILRPWQPVDALFAVLLFAVLAALLFDAARREPLHRDDLDSAPASGYPSPHG